MMSRGERVFFFFQVKEDIFSFLFNDITWHTKETQLCTKSMTLMHGKLHKVLWKMSGHKIQFAVLNPPQPTFCVRKIQ